MAELVGAFDVVRAEHEAMAAEMFNDDGTYKAGINQVNQRPREGGGEGHAVSTSSRPFARG